MRYEIWFQNSHIMIEVEANNSAEARNNFNRMVNCKRIKGAEKKSGVHHG